jgi:adenosylcobinamide-phosphate synthase
MSFISVLFALLLEQARPLAQGNPIHAGMRAWVRWCTRNFDAGKSWHGWLAWGLSVGGVPALTLLIYWALNWFLGWPFGVVWSALVLYASLGFRQFSSHFTQIRDALADGDDLLARQLFAKWRNVDTREFTQSEMVGRVIEHSVLEAHHHVFGVLAWFSVLAAFGLGPVGAVLYRFSEFVTRYWQHKSEAHHQPVSDALQRNARAAWLLIDWLPARITAISFAVVGNFEEAIDGWRRYAEGTDTSHDGLVLAATAGAVNLRLPSEPSTSDQMLSAATDVRGQPPELAHLPIVVGLVWRTVVMWLVLLALLTLARLLG